MKTFFQLFRTYSQVTLFTLFLLGVMAIVGTFLYHFGIGESGYNFLGKTKRVTLSTGAPITQTFTAHDNRMHQVQVILRNVHFEWGDTLTFSLLDETCQKAIATTDWNAEPDKQGAYTVFSFDPIADSKDKKYCFSATYFSEKNRKGEKPYLSATDAPDAVFSDRILTDTNKNKVYTSQTLFLRPAYTGGSLTHDLWSLVTRLTEDKPAVFNNWILTLLFATLMIGSIVFAYFIVFTKAPTHD